MDVLLPLREQLQDGGAGKSVDPAPDVPEPDAAFQSQEHLPARQAMLVAVAEPCKQGAAQSAERSCAAQEAEVQLALEVLLVEAWTLVPEAALKL